MGVAGAFALVFSGEMGVGFEVMAGVLAGGDTFVSGLSAFFVLGAFNLERGFFFNFFSEELLCLRFIIHHVEKATQTQSLRSLCQGLRMKQQKIWRKRRSFIPIGN